MNIFPITIGLVIYSFFQIEVQASSKKSNSNLKKEIEKEEKLLDAQVDIRKVIELIPLEKIRLEIPDRAAYNFGSNLESKLATRLSEKGQYQVIQRKPLISNGSEQYSILRSDPRSQPVTLKLKIDIKEIFFRSGSKATRSYYGFDSFFKNKFNDGTYFNEFVKKPEEKNYFGKFLTEKGNIFLNTKSGVEIGESITVPLPFGGIKARYQSFLSGVRLDINLTIYSPQGTSEEKSKEIYLSSQGYYDACNVEFNDCGIGFKNGKKDAVEEVFEKSIDDIYLHVEELVREYPSLVTVKELNDNFSRNGDFFLTLSKQDPGVKIGTLFESGKFILRIKGWLPQGCLAHLVFGNPSMVHTGMIFTKMRDQTYIPGLTFSKSVNDQEEEPDDLISSKEYDISASEDLSEGIARLTKSLSDDWEGKLKETFEGLFIPYRLWRFYQYKQPYKFYTQKNKELNSQKINRPIVAVIDSGVDYNHPDLKNHIWINSKPQKRFNLMEDLYGWDFFSNDSRPFDDIYHGTQVASVVVQEASNVLIMPLKIFNPDGDTHSAGILGAFQYAVDHGAQIILCAWATDLSSQALREGIQYAHSKGVVVVTAAGDDSRNIDQTKNYPSALSHEFDHILTVASTDALGNISKTSNFGSQAVHLGAPGEDIVVAEPRKNYSKASSSGLSAAAVTGRLVKLWNDLPSEFTPAQKIQRFLLIATEPHPSLVGTIENGRILLAR